MAKLTLTDVQSGYQSKDAVNDNHAAIEAALENTLSRDGTTPNQMNADLDMNGYYLLNTPADSSETEGFLYRGDWVGGGTTYAQNNLVSLTIAQDGTNGGASYICLVDHDSDATFANDLASVYWRKFAGRGASGAGSGDLVSTSNLSDVANTDTARDNLSAVEDVLTTEGDLLVEGASGPERLGVGSADQHLGSDGTDPVWTSGAWEFVAEFEPSADASFTIHHAGFDGTPTNMLDDYTYLVRGYLFGTDEQQAVVQLFEDVTGTPTLRNGGSDYQRSHVGHSSAISAVGSAPNSNMLLAQALWGTTIDAACHFETVVNGIESGVVTTVFSRSVGVTDAGADYQFSTMGYTYDSGTSATRKLDYINVFPTTGTCTGKLKLYRQKGV